MINPFSEHSFCDEADPTRDEPHHVSVPFEDIKALRADIAELRKEVGTLTSWHGQLGQVFFPGRWGVIMSYTLRDIAKAAIRLLRVFAGEDSQQDGQQNSAQSAAQVV